MPLNTLRMWDSGVRQIPRAVFVRLTRALALKRPTTKAARATVNNLDENALAPLKVLAAEFGIHVATLQAAARTGTLAVHLSERSAFGRPVVYASRHAVNVFRDTHYRQSRRPLVSGAPVQVIVPSDYAERLKTLRGRLGVSQKGLAERIGAAGKAVVYQWEAGMRRPSPVFWGRIETLEHACPIK